MSTKKSTLKLQQLVALLSDGHHHSVYDIASKLYIGDPRSSIRDLRNHGINVDDEWVPSVNGGKYKRYWINTNQGGPE